MSWSRRTRTRGKRAVFSSPTRAPASSFAGWWRVESPVRGWSQRAADRLARSGWVIPKSERAANRKAEVVRNFQVGRLRPAGVVRLSVTRARLFRLSATSGSTAAARRAGTIDAASPEATRTRSVVRTTDTSNGSTLNKSCVSCAPSRNPRPAPSTSPIPSSTIPWRTTMRRIRDLSAPSAIRIPISDVRRRTANAITPYRPALASSIAAMPNAENSPPNTRMGQVRSS